MDVENTNIISIEKIITPNELKTKFPLDKDTEKQIIQWRTEVDNIIKGKNNRMLVIIGPCSIHDVDAAIDYASRLKILRDYYQDKLFIIMRVYFEKPRTTVGWKGLINDPELNGTYNINKGLEVSRELLLEINRMGIPTGCEFLDVFNPQYYADLVSWGAIGARTTESQLHRELASGLSMPIGFKNGTSGNVDIAIDAVICANHPHVFMGINNDGNSSIVKTSGNNSSHIILRGGINGPNYDHVNIGIINKMLKIKNITTKVIIDCSHGNSGKSYKNQPLVIESIMSQINHGEQNICGVMIESNIFEGCQKHDVKNGKEGLEYGKSITDECVNLETSVKMLERMVDTKVHYFESDN
jgi:3-deoxy-7-phosphoheptulonate synthase